MRSIDNQLALQQGCIKIYVAGGQPYILISQCTNDFSTTIYIEAFVNSEKAKATDFRKLAIIKKFSINVTSDSACFPSFLQNSMVR